MGQLTVDNEAVGSCQIVRHGLFNTAAERNITPCSRTCDKACISRCQTVQQQCLRVLPKIVTSYRIDKRLHPDVLVAPVVSVSVSELNASFPQGVNVAHELGHAVSELLRCHEAVSSQHPSSSCEYEEMFADLFEILLHHPSTLHHVVSMDEDTSWEPVLVERNKGIEMIKTDTQTRKKAAGTAGVIYLLRRIIDAEITLLLLDTNVLFKDIAPTVAKWFAEVGCPTTDEFLYASLLSALKDALYYNENNVPEFYIASRVPSHFIAQHLFARLHTSRPSFLDQCASSSSPFEEGDSLLSDNMTEAWSALGKTLYRIPGPNGPAALSQAVEKLEELASPEALEFLHKVDSSEPILRLYARSDLPSDSLAHTGMSVRPPTLPFMPYETMVKEWVQYHDD
ncbi:MAG: hypothetical protein MHM6MM_008995 [Cercozoa sp. M6MM]